MTCESCRLRPATTVDNGALVCQECLPDVLDLGLLAVLPTRPLLAAVDLVAVAGLFPRRIG